MKLGGTLVFVASVWLWLVQTQIPDAGAEWPGPRGFPQLLGVVLAALGLLLIAAGLRPPTIRGRETSPTNGEGPPKGARHDARVALATCTVLVFYAFLLDRTGFPIATMVVVVVTMAAVLRMRQRILIAGLALGLSLACWVIFNTLLGIPLPSGAWNPW